MRLGPAPSLAQAKAGVSPLGDNTGSGHVHGVQTVSISISCCFLDALYSVSLMLVLDVLQMVSPESSQPCRVVMSFSLADKAQVV